jgi:MFS family permease
MVGLGETNFPLFALALAKSEGVAGLLATVPQLIGATMQLCAPWGLRQAGSPRRWIMWCATIQCLSFVPMVAAAYVGAIPTWLLFAVASLYWAVNLGAAPAWNTWMGALIPKRIRAPYFGFRSRLYQLCTLGALLLGGLILALGDPARAERIFGATLSADTTHIMGSFAIVFSLAGLSRLWSVWFLKGHSEVASMNVRQHKRVDWWEFLGRVRRSPDGRVLMAMALMTISVQIAQPFFLPYMSKQLNFSDSEVLAIIAASFAAKSAAAPFWGRFAHRHGARRLFVMGALGTVPISLLWMVSGNFWYLLALQGVTGAVFGAFELGFFFLSLEAIREDERTSMLATYIVLNSFAAAAGSLIGNSMFLIIAAPMAAYMAMFGLSALCRLLAFLPVKGVRTDVLAAEPISTQPMALRPSSGSIEFPEPASLQHESHPIRDDAPR